MTMSRESAPRWKIDGAALFTSNLLGVAYLYCSYRTLILSKRVRVV